MKNLLALVIGLTLSQAAFGSGCTPYDVFLAEEKSVAFLGEFKTHTQCQESGCDLTAYDTKTSEYHKLKQQKQTANTALAPQKDIGNIAVHMYRQYWVSSCDEIVRYVVGSDINGIRYREANDLTEL
ncbi:MAG: hypothetical protein V4654_05220 [Bdellovibrionota bacterium]